MLCPYCGFDKAPERFTDEHVIPKALGGGLQPTNPFLLRVCVDCNAACGRWIDGPFVRSYLIHNARASCGVEFCDPQAKPTVPLIYIGRMKAWLHADQICEFWLGPHGDHIYHFHRQDPKHATFVGKPPHVKPDQWDAGSVYIAFVTQDPIWHEIIYRSVRDAFKGAPLHFVNGAPQGHSAPYPAVPAARQPHIDFIRSLPDGEMPEHEIAMSIHAGTRFLAKLALGTGSLFLSPEFIGSPQAMLLRQFMWEKEPALRDAIAVRGTGFLAAGQEGNEVFAWPACHTIVLEQIDQRLGLGVNFYGTQAGYIEVSDERAHWNGRMSDSGTAWVIAPGLRRFAGPMGLAGFVFAKATGKPTGDFAALVNALGKASRYRVDASR